MKQTNNSKKSVAFFERNSWYHRKKTLTECGKVKYGKVGGFKTSEEAEANYYKCLEEFKEQYRTFYGDTLKGDMNFKDYLLYWLENVYSKTHDSVTILGISYAVHYLIIPNIPYDIKLRLVTVNMLDEILLKVKDYSKYSAITARCALSNAFKDACSLNFISKNIADSITKYPREKAKIRVLNKQQLVIFLEAAKKTNWYLEILLGLFCGLRRGEILALKDTDFDFDNETVFIQRQLGVYCKLNHRTVKILDYNIIEKDVKTVNSIRKLKVPHIIIEEVKKRLQIINYQKEHCSHYNDNHYISCQENGDCHGLASLYTVIVQICKRCSLPKITVHSLRHMFATILLESGVPLEKVSKVLGHASIHTTFEYYCDTFEDKENILAFLNDTFDGSEDEYEQ